MIQKKVCMLGAFATGKTSLVSRLVKGSFSERYFTTVGVKIDRHLVEVDGEELTLIVWDLHGEDEFQRLRKTYLRGSSGCLFVVDGTRGVTLERAIRMHDDNEDVIGDIPFVVALNKTDVKDRWELREDELHPLTDRGWNAIKTSARTGEGVEDAFLLLAQKMRGGRALGTS